MLASAVERQQALFQQLDDMGPRNVEQIGCFLSRQLGMDRDNLDGIAIGQFGQDIHEQTQRRGRQFHLMGLVLLVEDLNALGFEFGREIGRQGTLAVHSRFHLALDGKRHFGQGSLGHERLR
ncbi:hypothetical protein D3C72_1579010 [compost metagenome]